MIDTYLNQHRHLIFSIHRHTHKAQVGNCLPRAETACKKGKKVAEYRIATRFLALSQAAGASGWPWSGSELAAKDSLCLGVSLAGRHVGICLLERE